MMSLFGGPPGGVPPSGPPRMMSEPGPPSITSLPFNPNMTSLPGPLSRTSVRFSDWFAPAPAWIAVFVCTSSSRPRAEGRAGAAARSDSGDYVVCPF
jgi:hypothetical protein